MRKEEVAAFAIMESVAEPVEPKNLEVIDKQGLFYVRFDTTLQSFNCLNRNRRNYSDEAMMRGLNEAHITELIRANSWKGEAGHPMEDDVKRILTIDPKLTSHKITSFRQQGKNILKGTIETLDDGHYGTQMTKNILQGMIPAFSLRALAKLTKKADGTSLVQSKPHIVTYDWVILPSHKEAYADTSKPMQKIVKSIKNDGNTVQESCVSVLESSLIDFIAEESTNVKLVSNIYEVALENMSLASNKKYLIVKENGTTYHVKIEDKIKRDVSKYLSML